MPAEPQPFRQAPIVAGVALVACGALLMRLNPHVLALPAPRERAKSPAKRFRGGKRLGGAAQQARDTLLDVLPDNLLTWIGRVLMLAGAAVVIVRLLDGVVGDRGDGAGRRR